MQPDDELVQFNNVQVEVQFGLVPEVGMGDLGSRQFRLIPEELCG